MVKKYFCDRCNKEMEVDPIDGAFNEAFESIGGSNMIASSIDNYYQQLIKVQLCPACLNIYNQMVNEMNDQIADFIKEKKVSNKRWFGLISN